MTNGPTQKPPWQPRFGLGSLMLVILVCSMTAAAGRYLILALTSGTSSRVMFVFFVLVLPIFLMLVLNGIRIGVSWMHRARRKR